MSRAITWLLALALIACLALAIYCLAFSRRAQRVVDAVDGPPLLRVPIDFSRPFTNEFNIRHTVQPLYGTIYLTLRAEPWPQTWNKEIAAGDDMADAGGWLRVFTKNNELVDEREMNWRYWRWPRGEAVVAPRQGFFGGLPLGEYKVVITTTSEVAVLKGSRQELLLRYEYIHEATIAEAGRKVGLFLLAVCPVLGGILFQRCRKGKRFAKVGCGKGE